MKNVKVRAFLLGIIVLTIASNLVHGEAQDVALTINPDGSISPETSLIVREDTTYTFKADIRGHITIKKSGITIDGDNYIFQGTGSES